MSMTRKDIYAIIEKDDGSNVWSHLIVKVRWLKHLQVLPLQVVE